MHKVYISGPMTGIEAYNFPAFEEGAVMVRNYFQCTVVSPHETDLEAGIDPLDTTPIAPDKYRDLLAADLRDIMDCDGIAFLPEWQKSNGARVERAVAQALGLRMYQIDLLKGTVTEETY